MKTAFAVIGALLLMLAAHYAFTLVWPREAAKGSAELATPMKEKLPKDVYHIMYEKGTEPSFSSPLNDEHRSGTFVTADTGLPVYRSEDKFDSGTGWPSFVKPIDGGVKLVPDNSFFMHRTEVVSADTGAHLGHVFDDGPANRGGKRYCMNGLALKFIPDDNSASTTKSADQ